MSLPTVIYVWDHPTRQWDDQDHPVWVTTRYVQADAQGWNPELAELARLLAVARSYQHDPSLPSQANLRASLRAQIAAAIAEFNRLVQLPPSP